jgi:hypothetical protein
LVSRSVAGVHTSARLVARVLRALVVVVAVKGCVLTLISNAIVNRTRVAVVALAWIGASSLEAGFAGPVGARYSQGGAQGHGGVWLTCVRAARNVPATRIPLITVCAAYGVETGRCGVIAGSRGIVDTLKDRPTGTTIHAVIV